MKITNQWQKGFTLVEVLVAVLVLSLGLFGLAGMQSAGLRFSQGAYLKSQATVVLSDIVDRMRSNPDGVTAGYYDAFDSRDDIPSDQNCGSANCTAVQLASQDLREWMNHFRDVFGLGSSYMPTLTSGSFGTVSNAGGVYTVTVVWNEIKARNTGAEENPTKSLSVQVVF